MFQKQGEFTVAIDSIIGKSLMKEYYSLSLLLTTNAKLDINEVLERQSVDVWRILKV